MPFYVVPFDLLLLSPLYLANPDMYKNICVGAGNGGFVPWQAGWATALGRFQIVLGREVGFTFYGLRGTDEFVAPGDTPGSIHLVGVRSTAIRIAGARAPAIPPVLGQPELGTAPAAVHRGRHTARRPGRVAIGPAERSAAQHWFVGVRLAFDWRYYP